jgi:mannosyltransferase OCH1-like enzyme
MLILLFTILLSFNCLAKTTTTTNHNNEFPLFASFESFVPDKALDDSPLVQLVKKLYKRNNLGRIAPSDHPRIPKIIHQIWLGGPVPDKFKSWMESWKIMHPDWKYILWTDADIKNFRPYVQNLLSKSHNFGQKADILRYEILYQFGGVYADVDCECLMPFDLLNHCYDFYVGITIPSRTILIENSILACTPGHPIMRAFIESIKEVRCQTNFDIFDSTGPRHITRIFQQIAPCIRDRIIVFPPTFFSSKSGIGPETFVAHYCTGSWDMGK